MRVLFGVDDDTFAQRVADGAGQQYRGKTARDAVGAEIRVQDECSAEIRLRAQEDCLGFRERMSSTEITERLEQLRSTVV